MILTEKEAKRLEELEVEKNTRHKVGNGERAGLTYEEWDELFTLRKKKEKEECLS